MKNTFNILYLEDNQLHHGLVQETLAKEGIHCRLIAVDSKPAFIKALKDFSIDLILADYDHPVF